MDNGHASHHCCQAHTVMNIGIQSSPHPTPNKVNANVHQTHPPIHPEEQRVVGGNTARRHGTSIARPGYTVTNIPPQRPTATPPHPHPTFPSYLVDTFPKLSLSSKLIHLSTLTIRSWLVQTLLTQRHETTSTQLTQPWGRGVSLLE